MVKHTIEKHIHHDVPWRLLVITHLAVLVIGFGLGRLL
jgi:hypothetical protein